MESVFTKVLILSKPLVILLRFVFSKSLCNSKLLWNLQFYLKTEEVVILCITFSEYAL